MNSSAPLGVFRRMTAGGTAVVLALVFAGSVTRPAVAGCACGKKWPHVFCAHHGQRYHTGAGDVQNLDTGGYWYWVRSPEQEQRVVLGLYNRYCVRCHGVDGRGVWDIPDVPDFTDPRWQASRPVPYRSRIILEGRGAVMPPFRGTLTLEEACAMVRYLHTFVPGTEVSRPDLGHPAAGAADNVPAAAAGTADNAPAAAAPAPPPPSTTTGSPFRR
jgi:hypothetical protein